MTQLQEPEQRELSTVTNSGFFSFPRQSRVFLPLINVLFCEGQTSYCFVLVGAT